MQKIRLSITWQNSNLTNTILKFNIKEQLVLLVEILTPIIECLLFGTQKLPPQQDFQMTQRKFQCKLNHEFFFINNSQQGAQHLLL
jgi:hypothetical protein